MKTKTQDLIGPALDWAVAKCEGHALREPITATYEDVQGITVPFYLREVVCTYRDNVCVHAEVKDIKVTRCGIHHEVGATSPSISFVDSAGRAALGDIGMFFINKDEAELAAQHEVQGGTDDFYPSTDWSQGGPIIDREGIDLYCNVPTNPDHPDIPWRGSWWARYHRCGCGTDFSYGPTALTTAMRCFVAFKLGDEVDVPEELLK